MITAIFNPGDKSITTKKVIQWDYGQVLSIKGLDLPKAVEIHFCVYTDSTTITTVGITTDDHTDVEIPDGLLRQDRELRAYVYVADLEQGKTVRTVNIPIQSRQKPEIPHTPEDAEIFREAIKAVNNSADRAETAANTSDQNAKKTAEDRAAIAEMVETVSGIEQQVQDVKKYAGQAETAASNAALSKQKAKESETAALRAKADAETAKGSAETAAGKTAEDRTAVESTKEEVLQAKQQVSADREVVEAVERNVAQMGNAIPQAVLEGVQAIGSAGAAEKQGIVQAGTEQKSAVESAGTKAVEGINLAKKSATDAVETAKTDAVGAVGTAGAEQTRNVTAEGEKQVEAVEDKGNEVLHSFPQDFPTQMDTKLDKQQGTEHVGKALVIGEDGLVVPGEVQSGGDGIAIVNTASGESPLVIPDSAERVNKGFGLTGNTEQVTTTGKNLLIERLSAFNTIKHHTEEETVAYVDLPEGHETKPYTMYIELKPGKTDTVGFTAGFYDKINMIEAYSAKCLLNGKLVNSNGLINSNVGVNHHICFKPAREEFFDIYNVIYTEGKLTSLPYEPYTGGKPSPSPEYPQEIKNVGKYNELTGKYDIDVMISGKNLLDISACEDGKVLDTNGDIINNAKALLTDFIPCFPKTSYCRTEGHFTVVVFYDVEKNKIGFINQYKPCFTTPDKCRYFKFSLNKTKVDYEKAVANVGKELADYEPYREPQTVKLSLDQPLRGIGKYKDEVTKDGIIRRIKQIVLNGSEEWILHNNTSKEKTQAFGIEVDTMCEGVNIGGICNRFLPRYTVWIVDNEGFDIYAMHTLYINIEKTKASSVVEFKKWLSENQIIIEAILKKPITEPLPEDFKQAIESLKTYYPTTIVTADGGEVDPDIEVTYIADTKNYIDQKIAPVIKSVVETQKALL